MRRSLLSLFALVALNTGAAADDGVPSSIASLLPDAPRGKVVEMPPWQSKIYPNTVRAWSIYVPAQYRPESPAPLIVFPDGQEFLDRRGSWRVPVVLDQLISEGSVPPVIAVMIAPGSAIKEVNSTRPVVASQRSLELEGLGDRCAHFLLDEILPEIEKQYRISSDPEQRAIAGSGSGAVCAFTVAWERPDAFRKVLCLNGTFTNVGGANGYPSLIRKTERKPLRVLLDALDNEVETVAGHARLSIQHMHAALKYMGYDCRFEAGGKRAAVPEGASFPAALRWLWRQERPTPVIDTKGDLGGDLTLHRLLIDGQGWEPVMDGLGFVDGPCSDDQDGIFVSDLKANRIWNIGADGKPVEFLAEGVSGLKQAPDGKLYGCQGSKKRIIAIDPATRKTSAIVTEVEPNDLVITHRGHLYFTETGRQQVTMVNLATGEKRVVDRGIGAPNGITLSPDEGTLVVSDYRGQNVWCFRVDADGSLSARAPYMTMRCPPDPKVPFVENQPPAEVLDSGGDGMSSDSDGRYYVATKLGVQVFDPTGRPCGLLGMPPGKSAISSCALAGPDLSYLYVTQGDAVYRRKVQAHGVRYHLNPQTQRAAAR